MQISIDKKTGVLAGIIFVLLFAVSILAMPYINGRVYNDGMMGMHNSRIASYDSLGSFTGNEVMFFQMMIPHHQQAVDISDLALTTSKDRELLALAQAIRDGQESEIVKMRGWLSSTNAGLDTDHGMGSGMGGMLSDSELQTLQGFSGDAFDAYWLQGMIVHHEGALHMILMIQDSSNSEVSTLAKEIEAVQTAQIAQMKKMLNKRDVTQYFIA
ncbi:MAG TPA: DUF305 domain-containing protein [Candidatus Paceibacterota bacterium]|nr:DUF305 domain-containing protein [Candidatus Paceibacterota bacterium]